jgi:hypothetical protein
MSTYDGWFEGETKSPRHETIAATITAVGYEERYVKSKDIDLEKELVLAEKWRKRQIALREKARAMIAAEAKKVVRKRSKWQMKERAMLGHRQLHLYGCGGINELYTIQWRDGSDLSWVRESVAVRHALHDTVAGAVMIYIISILAVAAISYSIVAYRYGYRNGYYSGVSHAMEFNARVSNEIRSWNFHRHIRHRHDLLHTVWGNAHRLSEDRRGNPSCRAVPPMTDIIERLLMFGSAYPECREAAEEIKHLRSNTRHEIDRLRTMIDNRDRRIASLMAEIERLRENLKEYETVMSPNWNPNDYDWEVEMHWQQYVMAGLLIGNALINMRRHGETTTLNGYDAIIRNAVIAALFGMIGFWSIWN